MAIGKHFVALAAVLALLVITRTAHADDWKTVDCTTVPFSVDGAPTGKTCQRGPDIPTVRNGCYIPQFNMVWPNGDGFSYIYMERVDVGRCYLQPLDSDSRLLLKTVNGANQGKLSNLGEPVAFLGGHVVDFMRGADHCFGFLQQGDPSTTGYSYHIHGQFCVAGNGSLDEALKRRLLASIKLGKPNPDTGTTPQQDKAATAEGETIENIVEPIHSVISDTRHEFGFFYALNADCKPMGTIKVDVPVAPKNGQVWTEPGVGRPNFPATNTHFACNKKQVDMTTAYFRSKPDFAGMDATTILVSFPNGVKRTYEYSFYVGK